MIYRFTAVPIKISAIFSSETDKVILKFLWKGKEPFSIFLGISFVSLSFCIFLSTSSSFLVYFLLWVEKNLQTLPEKTAQREIKFLKVHKFEYHLLIHLACICLESLHYKFSNLHSITFCFILMILKVLKPFCFYFLILWKPEVLNFTLFPVF